MRKRSRAYHYLPGDGRPLRDPTDSVSGWEDARLGCLLTSGLLGIFFLLALGFGLDPDLALLATLLAFPAGLVLMMLWSGVAQHLRLEKRIRWRSQYLSRRAPDLLRRRLVEAVVDVETRARLVAADRGWGHQGVADLARRADQHLLILEGLAGDRAVDSMKLADTRTKMDRLLESVSTLQALEKEYMEMRWATLNDLHGLFRRCHRWDSFEVSLGNPVTQVRSDAPSGGGA
jgi:hypothetical protein